MTFPETIFRIRRWLLAAIILFGFWAPWERVGGSHPASAWLVLSSWLTRSGVLSIGDSVIAVMAVAILLALLAALLRTWGTAYLGSAVVHDSALQGERLVADGPYRYLRNPLYVGTWLHTLALAILMPVGGALFAVIAVAAVNAVKVRVEERHLLATRGEAYAAYARKVPRFFFSFRARVPDGGARAHWADGFMGELYFWGVFVTYAVFAGRYDSLILEQGILVSLGIAIVVRGAMTPRVRVIG